MQLYERLRPQTLEQVVGQDKAVAVCRGLIAAGLGGRAVLLTGQSGTGKTTIAKILAGELAHELCTDELDAGDLTVARLKDFERHLDYRGMGGNGGRAVIVNEAHGLKREVVRQLLVTLERIPTHCVWIFTTTNDGQAALFEGTDDAGPLFSRCLPIPLARQGYQKQFAEYLRGVDPAGPGDPKAYLRLVQDCKGNMRACLQKLEAESLGAFANAVDEAA